MSDQNARERIEDLFANYTGEGDPASEVLAIVREALLSPDALEAAADIWNNHHAPTCDRAIQAAWEAAFGADDDGGER